MTNTSKASESSKSASLAHLDSIRTNIKLRRALEAVSKAYIKLYDAAFAEGTEGVYGTAPSDEERREIEQLDDIYHRLTEDPSFEQRLTRGQ